MSSNTSVFCDEDFVVPPTVAGVWYQGQTLNSSRRSVQVRGLFAAGLLLKHELLTSDPTQSDVDVQTQDSRRRSRTTLFRKS